MSRIAILSDVHANYHALCAVAEDAHSVEGCTEIACLGDMVGFNAHPLECLDYFRELNCIVVKGRHEQLLLDMEFTNIDPLAEASLQWTREIVTEEQLRWMASLPYQRIVRPEDGKGSSFIVTHSSLDQPRSWNKIASCSDAVHSMARQFANVAFCGHTHSPAVYISERQGVSELPCVIEEILMNGSVDIKIQSGCKYCINVGSVGQPRGAVMDACYAVYDTAEGLVRLKRVAYDVRAAQQAIVDSGLPIALAACLGPFEM